MSHSTLHQAQSHPILRSWQSQRNDINHHTDFVLPMFIGNHDDLVEPIDSMPGVSRYGCNKAIEYLEPLVYSFGLRAVLLFPVATKAPSDLALTMSSSGSSSSSASSSSRSSDERSTGTTGTEADGSGEDSDESLKERLVPDNIGPDGRRDKQEKMGTLTRMAGRERDVQLIKAMALKDEHNPVLRLIPRLREKFPNLLIICDVCLCAFTSTGHCCLFDDSTKFTTKNNNGSSTVNNNPGDSCEIKRVLPSPSSNHIQLEQYQISNKITCQYLAKLAAEYALRGCNVLAPSDMMDGRIQVIREKLNEMNLYHVSIMSYSAKFASSFYGPFRQAACSKPQFGDRRAYQLPPGSRAMALKAVSRDIDQGADFVMVKPGTPYLDIVRDVRESHPNVPIAIYQVSGEYSMLKLAAEANVLDLKSAIHELLASYRRAGANIIITYFTPAILKGELQVLCA